MIIENEGLQNLGRVHHDLPIRVPSGPYSKFSDEERREYHRQLISIWSDGVKFYVNGNANVRAGITFT